MAPTIHTSSFKINFDRFREIFLNKIKVTINGFESGLNKLKLIACVGINKKIMASKGAKMDPAYLQPKELNYELVIRSIFNSRDNYRRRRQALNVALRLEDDPLKHATSYTFESDKAEAVITINWLDSMRVGENREFPKERLYECESRTLHVVNRLIRMVPPNDTEQAWINNTVDRLREMLQVMEDSYVEGVEELPEQVFDKYSEYSAGTAQHESAFANGDKPNDTPTGDVRSSRVPKSASKNTGTIPKGNRRTIPVNESMKLESLQIQIENLIKQRDELLRKSGDAKATGEGDRNSTHSQTPGGNGTRSESKPKKGNTTRDHQSDTKQKTTGSAKSKTKRRLDSRRVTLNDFDEETEDESDDCDEISVIDAPTRTNESNRRQQARRSATMGRPSMPRHNSTRIPTDTPNPNVTPNNLSPRNNNCLAVHKWPFYFDGVTQVSNGKSLDLYDFLERVKEFSCSEGVSGAQILDKMQFLLRGAAEKWYRRCKGRITRWSEFRKEIQSRFCREDFTDDLRQTLYTRRQQPGEYTLEYVDDLCNLMNRLPEEMSDDLRLRNVLRGIRKEVRLMAQAHGVMDEDDLVCFIRKSFGPDDKMYGKVIRSEPEPRLPKPRSYNAAKADVTMRSTEAPSDSDDSHARDDEDSNEISEMKTEKRHKTQYGRSELKPITASKIDNVSKARTATDVGEAPVNDRNGTDLQNVMKNVNTQTRNCHFCGSNTHFIRECPKRPTTMASEKTEPKTKLVHEASIQTEAESYWTMSEDSSGTTSAPSVPSVANNATELCELRVSSLVDFPETDGRPHCPALANGWPLHGLLDTGAQVTIIGKNIYHENRGFNVPLKPSTITITTADGTRHQPLGIIDVTYEVKGKSRTVPTCVAPMWMKKPLFGVDFQKAFNIKLLMECDMVEVVPVKEKITSMPHQLTGEQQARLNEVIKLFPFSNDEGELNFTTKVEHEIDTGSNKPVQQKPYLISPLIYDRVRAEIERMEARGIIKRIDSSEYNLPIIPVPKSDGRIRLVLDAKKLNKITKKNKYPSANLEYVYSRMPPNCDYYSSVDVTEAYHQIKLSEDSQEKCSFSVFGIGKFSYVRMPMGLVNSAATLAKLVNETFTGDDLPYFHTFVDDFLCVSRTFEEHLEKLTLMASKLREAGLTVSEKNHCFVCRNCVGWARSSM